MYHGEIPLQNEAMFVIAVSDIKSNVVTEAKEQQHISRSTGMYVNLFTTIHDGNFRRHSSMNVTIK